MYLEHYKLKEYPFSLTPDTQYFTRLPQHQEALNVLLVGLQGGEGFIKIIGEVGVGKTLLCRHLLKVLEPHYVTAYLPNPDLTPEQLYMALADELEVEHEFSRGHHALLKKITQRLTQLHGQNKRVVLLIDEAQTLSVESLEALRLLTNLETEKSKLFQVVLFGQPELEERLAQPNLRQLRQRITFSFELKSLDEESLAHYVHHRLTIAGYNGVPLFQRAAIRLLANFSGGTPRVINILCHKALMVAFGEGHLQVRTQHIQRAIIDSELALVPKKPFYLQSFFYWILLGGMGAAFLSVWWLERLG